MNTSSKVAIVTGASRGIGEAIAKHLAKEGFALVVNYAGRAKDAEEVVHTIKAEGGNAIAIQADVSSSAAVAELFSKTKAHFGRIDVLVNNAGIMPQSLPTLVDTDDETFDQLFAVNVKGTFNTMREAAKYLPDGGRIVNFSSSVIGLGLPGYSVYGATKSAVETLTNIMAKELRGKGIGVNAVAPGPTATDLFLNGKTPEAIERLSKAAPLERLGTPDDIANIVFFLVSDAAGWVNGQTLRANGGLV